MKAAEDKRSRANAGLWISLILLGLLLILVFSHHYMNSKPSYLLLNDYFRLRSGPGTSYALCEEGERGSLYKLEGEVKGETTLYGERWYKVRCSDGSTAYIAASSQGEQELLNRREAERYRSFAAGLSPYLAGEAERYKDLEAFPASYREPLRGLKLLYPKWTFEPFFVPDPWPEVLRAELSPEYKNLVQYQETEYFAPYKDMVKHREISYDGADWYAADESAVAYFMDPRNFLAIEDIFQFLDLRYPKEGRGDEGVRIVFSGNEPMQALIPELMAASRTADILPEALAARMRQEVSGGSGMSLPARGLIDPYEPPLETDSPSPGFLSPEEQLAQLERLASAKGEEALSDDLKDALARARAGKRAFAEPEIRYYNFFNIGAYPDPGAVNGAAVNAARFAAGLFSEEGSARYKKLQLPWTSPEKAMTGGALFIADDYINAGQDTPYLQKFDLISGTYSHQYMQAVFAARNEGRRLFKVFKEAGMPEELHFKIPVYKDMPALNGEESGT